MKKYIILLVLLFFALVSAESRIVSTIPDWPEIRNKPTTIEGYGITDAVGLQGDKGDKGDTGDVGPEGSPGANGQNAPVYALLADGTTAMGFATRNVVKVTPTATATYTTTIPVAGSPCTLIILTSGTTSRTITFGTGFKPTGTLATGTTTARVFVIHWISDGVNLYESGRTAAMAS